MWVVSLRVLIDPVSCQGSGGVLTVFAPGPVARLVLVKYGSSFVPRCPGPSGSSRILYFRACSDLKPVGDTVPWNLLFAGLWPCGVNDSGR